MTHDKTIAEAAARAMTTEALGVALELFTDGPGDSIWPEVLTAELERRRTEQNVAVSLGGGEVIVGSVEVDHDGPEESAEDTAARAAAVAWNALTRNSVFTVNGRRYTARECAEWWA